MIALVIKIKVIFVFILLLETFVTVKKVKHGKMLVRVKS